MAEKVIADYWVPFFPPSVNQLYITLKNRRRIKNPAFKEKLQAFQIVSPKLTLKRGWYRLRMTFHMDLMYKNGTPRKWDASNRVKALEDSLMKIWDLDDCHILRSEAGKTQMGGEGEGTHIQLWYVRDMPPLPKKKKAKLKKKK